MSSERRMSNVSSSSSASSSEDIHAFAEEEEVNVSVWRNELMAEFKRDMETELNAMRASVTALNQEVSSLRAERDQAITEAQKLRELLDSLSQAAVNSTNARSPPRKTAKTSVVLNNTTAADFPALPSRPAAESVPSAISKSSVHLATMSTSTGATAAASTSRGTSVTTSSTRSAASTIKIATSGNTASNEASKFKKILQAIDTDVFKVRRVLSTSSATNFFIKQTSKRAPVKIVITDTKDILVVKAALAAEKIIYHEFKNYDERICFIIRGLIGGQR